MSEGVLRRVTVWSVAVGGAGAVLWAAVAPVVTIPGGGTPRFSTPLHAVPRLYPADALARLTVARPLFRVTRRPAAMAYDPQHLAPSVEAYQAPKPVLALVGLVAGAEPTAVIEGLPGTEGARVVRVGDQVSSVRVVRIASDHVQLVGMDTVWVLRVREPWKQ